MPRKSLVSIAVPVPGNFTPPPAKALTTQSSYGSEPWKPGEIPRAPLRTVIAGPKERQPYGEEMGVQKIGRRGSTAGTPGDPSKETASTSGKS